MDALAWIIAAVAGATALVLVTLAPRLLRRQLDRRLEGAGGSLSGVGGGFDSVWRPSAEEAHAEWEAQIEMPAPAPTPGDKGHLDDGRITIDLDKPTGP